MNCADEVNPMDWHNTRRVEFIPPHFTRVDFTHATNRGAVLSWLEQNITGRYAIEVIHDPDRAGIMFIANEKYRIGFENPADATMYSMCYR